MRRGEISALIVLILILAGLWWWREQKKEHARIWENASHCAKYKQGYLFQDVKLTPMPPTAADVARKNIRQVRPGMTEPEVIQLIGEPTAADIDSTKDNEFFGCIWEYQSRKRSFTKSPSSIPAGRWATSTP